MEWIHSEFRAWVEWLRRTILLCGFLFIFFVCLIQFWGADIRVMMPTIEHSQAKHR